MSGVSESDVKELPTALAGFLMKDGEKLVLGARLAYFSMTFPLELSSVHFMDRW